MLTRLNDDVRSGAEFFTSNAALMSAAIVLVLLIFYVLFCRHGRA